MFKPIIERRDSVSPYEIYDFLKEGDTIKIYSGDTVIYMYKEFDTYQVEIIFYLYELINSKCVKLISDKFLPEHEYIINKRSHKSMNIDNELLQIQELNYKLIKIKNTLRKSTEEIENKDLLIEELEQLENTINKIKELINL